ncbi:type VI secretion system ImpA family N-terminal domain-containing protein [Scandinavium sp. H11S7]|uniref:Type VI secretion system ImpA family N-terminal domain-containing protein n=1 Tax=Scandinavium hiltneri TaxID=2926519 RepID=A0ABT2E744_9ENTR|nr:VasL domain-containing protein [Scandinavium hiltneri]MCS2163716.1 type VI secretion system ImpA family N-terminal domain-containing protein [Scandinavium hiltneri]
MYDAKTRPVRTGGDPRALADFTTLRDEMNKLTHPARPDVNWARVESLSLSLFEQNGVELQTAAWYTLARSHLARINGLNEGAAILNALLAHQWAQVWPLQTASRAEILSGLSQRLQKVFRTFTLTHADLPPLYDAEKQLRALEEILTRQGLKQVCQFSPLLAQISSAATRLENSAPQETSAPALALPIQALQEPAAVSERAPDSRLVYVIHAEPEVTLDVVHELPSPSLPLLPAPPRWHAFAAGACSTLLLGAVALWGWNALHRVDATLPALSASVTPLPQVLSRAEIQRLRESGTGKVNADVWLKQASSQLDTLASLPPQWAQQQGNALLEQAKILWPDNVQVGEMRNQWQQKMALNRITDETLNGWHDGMVMLQRLTDQLNALDGQKGKYLTVSELKSQIFATTQAFNRAVPTEELLRQMALQDDPQHISTAQKLQTEQGLKQLITRYSQLNNEDTGK